MLLWNRRQESWKRGKCKYLQNCYYEIFYLWRVLSSPIFFSDNSQSLNHNRIMTEHVIDNVSIELKTIGKLLIFCFLMLDFSQS